MNRTLVSIAVAVAALTTAASANAYLVFTGVDTNGNPNAQVAATNSGAAETAFKANLVGVGTQNFESYNVGTNAAGVSPISFGVAGNATLSGTGTVQGNGVGATNGFGRYSVPGGVRYWEANATGGDFSVTFTNEIAAFGFYGIDLGDFLGTLALEFYNSANALISTQAITTAAQNVADGSILYYGFIAQNAAEEFKRVRFVSTGGTGDIFAFDSFTIGTREQVVLVPEPATLALVGAALLGLGASRRRRA